MLSWSHSPEFAQLERRSSRLGAGVNAVVEQRWHDWANPDYSAELARRATILEALLTGGPTVLAAMRDYYAQDSRAADFIADFAYCYEPRNVERGLPSKIPFIPFPKQRACVEWMLARWRSSEPGIVEKCRDAGVSALAMMLFAWLCIFHRGVSCGVGSALERKVDNGEDPDSLLFKARFFVSCLPACFRGGFDENNPRLRPHMKMFFPETGSSIIGEAGERIGRGGRRTIFAVDEAGHLMQPQEVDKALASNTNCRLDLSSVPGMGSPFARKRHSGKYKVFTFRVSDDPRQGPEYLERMRELHDPVTFNQEFMLDYHADTSGGLIQIAHLHSCIDARRKLGLAAAPTGWKQLAFDPEGEGKNRCALAARHGTDLTALVSWSGKESQQNVFKSLLTAIAFMDEWGFAKDGVLVYDGDGLGQGINELLAEAVNPPRAQKIRGQPYFGSAAVEDPEGDWIGDGRTNAERFANFKAQSWMMLARRIQRTFLAVMQGLKIDPDEIFSIDPALPELDELLAELTQIRYSRNGAGKIVIDKTPDGFTSPDRADAVCMAFAPLDEGLEVWVKLGSR
jgi:phage terminase large subunit